MAAVVGVVMLCGGLAPRPHARSSSGSSDLAALECPAQARVPAFRQYPAPSDPRSLYEFIREACADHGSRLAFSFKPKAGAGGRRDMTYVAFSDMVMRVARSLAVLGVRRKTRVMLLAANSVEWAACALAANALGAAWSALYPQAKATEWVYVFRDASPVVLVVDNMQQWDRLRAAARDMGARLPPVSVVVIGRGEESTTLVVRSPSESGTASRAVSRPCPRLVPWDEFLELGVQDRRHLKLGRGGPFTMAAIVYTSGTTGAPKGAMLTNWNILSNLLPTLHIGGVAPGERYAPSPAQELAPPEGSLTLHATVFLLPRRTASFLPWAHTFGTTFDLLFMLRRGAHINLVSNVSRIAEEAQV